MKKIVLLSITIIVLSLYAVGQEEEYEMYRCDKISHRTKDDAGTWLEWEHYEMKSLIIRNDLNLNVFEINLDPIKKIYLLKKLSDADWIDDEGDRCVTTIYSGYDEKSLKCEWSKIDYPGLTNINFRLAYSNSEYFFRCKIIVN